MRRFRAKFDGSAWLSAADNRVPPSMMGGPISRVGLKALRKLTSPEESRVKLTAYEQRTIPRIHSFLGNLLFHTSPQINKEYNGGGERTKGFLERLEGMPDTEEIVEDASELRAILVAWCDVMEHDDPDCKGGDTCECQNVARIERILHKTEYLDAEDDHADE